MFPREQPRSVQQGIQFVLEVGAAEIKEPLSLAGDLSTSEGKFGFTAPETLFGKVIATRLDEQAVSTATGGPCQSKK